jgi:hypothetical protein
VTVHDVLHDREPKAGPALLPAFGDVDAVEPLRQPGEMLRRDPGAMISHAQLRFRVGPVRPAAVGEGDFDTAPALAVLDGVLDQVLGHPQKFVPIAENPERLGRGRDRDRHAALADEGREGVDHVDRYRNEVDDGLRREMRPHLDAG